MSAQYVSKTTNSTLDKPQNKPQEPVKPVYDKWVGCCYKASTTVFSTATGQDKLSTYPKLGKNNLFDVVGEERIRYKIVIAGKYTGYISKDDVRNSKDKYPRLGKVVTKGGTLNLRKAPINGAIVKEMPNGSGVTIKNVKIQNGEKWYEVKYNTHTGYASAQYIKEA